MARWRLAAAHYLRTEGIKWEYSETDRKTGRPKRVQFDVPMYLNPHDPGDWNHKWGNKDDQEGEIIVRQGEGHERDYEFFGDPTPDMVPLDPEAERISASFAERWRYKPEEGISYSQSLVDGFQTELAEVQSKPVEIPGMTDLVAAMNAQSAMIGKMIEAQTIVRRA